MWRGLLAAAASLAVVTSTVVTPAWSHPEGGEHEDTEASGQHGDPSGHLPPSTADVALVGRLDDLTAVPNGIADVTAFAGYAYLNAFRPECGGSPGAQGTGVHVVDVSDPTAPRKVNFLPAEGNSYPGEGVHVFEFAGRHILLHNNESCDQRRHAESGVSMWDVTNPVAATKIGQFGDRSPVYPTLTYHTTHSVQGFVWRDRAYAVAQDNDDVDDVDIFDITPAILGDGPAVLVAEVGFDDWPAAQSPLALGDRAVHHDMQQKVVDGHNLLLVSYWDAGQILLDIDDPANPVFVTDSDFTTDLAGHAIAEGNSHQSYWSEDGTYVLSTDEDFSPTRTLCEVAAGQHGGPTPCGELAWTDPLGSSTVVGPTLFGGSGCIGDLNGNGVSDRAEVPPATSPDQIVVFSQGSCFSSDKVHTGELKGYRTVALGNSHVGSRDGLVPDALSCPSAGSTTLGTAHGICIGHRAMHLLFDDPPAYAAPEGFEAGGDLPAIGTVGAPLQATGGVFDGWGYIRLHRADTLDEIGTYAVREGMDPAYSTGFGNLTVHEVKTDPRRGVDLAYAAYYAAGLRVLSFGDDGLREVGHFIGEGGNDFWGVYPVCTGECLKNDRDRGRGRDDAKRPLILTSDRDSGLWIFRYTGKE